MRRQAQLPGRRHATDRRLRAFVAVSGLQTNPGQE